MPGRIDMTLPAREDFEFRIGGRRLAAARWQGDDDAPCIVMLHEGLGAITLWRDFPSALSAATGCTVLAYDRFGYGRSDPAPLPWPVRYMHDEALAVLPRLFDAAGISRAITLGHSDGASIALIHAGGMQDGRLCGTILIAPHLFVEDIAIARIEAAREAYEATDLRDRLARHHRDPDNAFHGWNRTWLSPAFRGWRIDDLVPSIRVPVLAFQGSDDEYGSTAQLAPLAGNVHCLAETQLIAGAGHAPHLSHREDVLRFIVPFVTRARCPPRAGTDADRA
jgi:pimeloyl-ACP methyl ester carboxylesterase